MPSADFNTSVFVNCPFDQDYQPILRAIVFAIFDCGLLVRCAQEEEDASVIRIDKICRMIEDCRYGIHDISRTELDEQTGLPRFNMPLELGVFLGAKRFGGKTQRNKKCLIVDTEPYRYQQFISDISGQDVQPHGSDPLAAIGLVRNWLRNSSNRTTIPGASVIRDRYLSFLDDLPEICEDLKLNPNELIFNDYTLAIAEWLKQED